MPMLMAIAAGTRQCSIKVERFHRYLRGNFYVPLASRLRQSGLVLDVDTANAEVGKWLRDVANQRVHPVTGSAPAVLFEQRTRNPA